MADPRRPTLDYRNPSPPPRDPFDRALDRFEMWSTIGFLAVVAIFAAISGVFVHGYLR